MHYVQINTSMLISHKTSGAHCKTFHNDRTTTLTVSFCFLAGPCAHTADRLFEASQDLTNHTGSNNDTGGPHSDTKVNEAICGTVWPLVFLAKAPSWGITYN